MPKIIMYEVCSKWDGAMKDECKEFVRGTYYYDENKNVGALLTTELGKSEETNFSCIRGNDALRFYQDLERQKEMYNEGANKNFTYIKEENVIESLNDFLEDVGDFIDSKKAIKKCGVQ